MASDLEPYFDDDAERLAYETFCMEQERGDARFTLDAPVLVCRWRMANKHVPMLNRHIRALSQRRVNGEPLTHNMLCWVKQHVEWSLAEGAYTERDGVLMLVIDVNGNAVMTVGPYEPLTETSAVALAARVTKARVEAGETGVAPELLCTATADGRLLIGAAAGEHLCGVATLVEQLASARGHEVARMPDLDVSAVPDAAFFLVSDEHGVVPASDGAAASEARATVDFLASGYQKLFS